MTAHPVLTARESAVLVGVLLSEFTAFNGALPPEGYVFDAFDFQVWSDCLEGRGLPSGKALSGVVSSLCRKGLLTSDGECVMLTESGYQFTVSAARHAAAALASKLPN